MLAKPIITDAKNYYLSKVCSLTVDTPKLGKLDAAFCDRFNGYNSLITTLSNAKGEEIGSEYLSVDLSRNELNGFWISADPKYRNKNYGIGELLNLVSIIGMLENKINSIRIFSKNNVVYFHSKYKFCPDINIFKERNNALQSLANVKSPELEYYRENAENLLKTINETKDASMQREMCKTASLLVKEFIQKVFNLGKKEYTKYPFENGMSMRLTKEEIYKNRDFFNELFKKNGIDYNI